MSFDPPIDDTAICPACDGSGFGVADTMCGLCGGCGGLPLSAAQDFENRRRGLDAALTKAGRTPCSETVG